MSELEIAARVLIVDDEEAMRVFLRRALKRQGYDPSVAESGDIAKLRLADESFDLLISDLKMPGCDGMELLGWCRRELPQLPVIVMTGHGSIRSAIDALKQGAENYITKPFDRDEILRAAEAALRARRLAAENRLLRRLLDDGPRFEGLIGASPPMRMVYRRIEEIAARDGGVLLLGESGTGKGAVAQALHARSPRAAKPFVTFSCPSVPPNLLAGELFGVERGAFTGADRSRAGAVQRAEGGTLFLDEIGELPLEAQPTLLRLLEERVVTPLGGRVAEPVDLRIVAATHRDLHAMVREGQFRDDLFYRLNVFPLELPALRERRGDIPDLMRHFFARLGVEEERIESELRQRLLTYDWPGNVRQLENLVERLVALAGEGPIGGALLPEEFLAAPESSGEEDWLPLKDAVAGFEAGYLNRLLRETRGNISEAARRAGVSRPTLHAKLGQLGIDAARFR